MKVEFELSDEGFRKAMYDHIGKNIAIISKELIEKRINEILEVQIDHITPRVVERMAENALDDKIKSVYGTEYAMRNSFNEIVLKAANALLRNS